MMVFIYICSISNTFIFDNFNFFNFSEPSKRIMKKLTGITKNTKDNLKK